MRWFVPIALTLLNIFDAHITLHFLKKGSTVELNPIAGFLIESCGNYFILLKGAVPALVGVFVWKVWDEYHAVRVVASIATVLYCFVSLYHLTWIVFG